MDALRDLPARGADGLCFTHSRSKQAESQSLSRPIRPSAGTGLPRAAAGRHAAFRPSKRCSRLRGPLAARRVLPSPSPQFTATAMWGPVLGWCVLELLAESIECERSGALALDFFDQLRLREPFAQAFAALGFEGEEGWRVAARIKVVLAHPGWRLRIGKRRPAKLKMLRLNQTPAGLACPHLKREC